MSVFEDEILYRINNINKQTKSVYDDGMIAGYNYALAIYMEQFNDDGK